MAKVFRYFSITIKYEAWAPWGCLPEGIVWLCGQEEVSHGTGYRHWQIACHSLKRIGINKLKSYFPKCAHIEPSRSAAADEYVVKLETSTGNKFVLGERPMKRNCAHDWELIWEASKRGQLELIPADIRFKFIRNIEHINGQYSDPKERELTVDLYVGPPGTGKTHKAVTENPEAYMKLSTNKWWDGYRGQKNSHH